MMDSSGYSLSGSSKGRTDAQGNEPEADGDHWPGHGPTVPAQDQAGLKWQVPSAVPDTVRKWVHVWGQTSQEH